MTPNLLTDLNLKVCKITSEAELKDILDSGLNKLYQAVFADPPYNEKFTSEVVNPHY